MRLAEKDQRRFVFVISTYRFTTLDAPNVHLNRLSR